MLYLFFIRFLVISESNEKQNSPKIGNYVEDQIYLTILKLSI